jgi:hypothetical protein
VRRERRWTSAGETPAGNWFAPPGSNRSGSGGNEAVEAFDVDIADLEADREEPWKRYPFLNASLDYVPNEPFRWRGAHAGLAWYRLTEP